MSMIIFFPSTVLVLYTLKWKKVITHKHVFYPVENVTFVITHEAGGTTWLQNNINKYICKYTIKNKK